MIAAIFYFLQSLKETSVGLQVNIRVKPSSHKFDIKITDNSIVISTKSIARDNNTNIEILKELKRLSKRNVSIVSGATTKERVLLIENCSIEQFRKSIGSG